MTVSERKYKAIENWFLKEAYPKLHVTPSEFDRIIFQREEKVLGLAAKAAGVGA